MSESAKPETLHIVVQAVIDVMNESHRPIGPRESDHMLTDGRKGAWAAVDSYDSSGKVSFRDHVYSETKAKILSGMEQRAEFRRNFPIRPVPRRSQDQPKPNSL